MWSDSVQAGTRYSSSNPQQIAQDTEFKQGEKYEFQIPQASADVVLDPQYNPPSPPTEQDYRNAARLKADQLLAMFKQAIIDQQGQHVKVLYQSFNYTVIDQYMEDQLGGYKWHVQLQGSMILQVQDIGFAFTASIIIAIAIGLSIVIASIAASVSIYHLVGAAADWMGGLGAVVIVLGVLAVGGTIAYVVLSSPKGRARVKSLGRRGYRAARRRLR
jgi:hypothetical protein